MTRKRFKKSQSLLHGVLIKEFKKMIERNQNQKHLIQDLNIEQKLIANDFIFDFKIKIEPKTLSKDEMKKRIHKATSVEKKYSKKKRELVFNTLGNWLDDFKHIDEALLTSERLKSWEYVKVKDQVWIDQQKEWNKQFEKLMKVEAEYENKIEELINKSNDKVNNNESQLKSSQNVDITSKMQAWDQLKRDEILWKVQQEQWNKLRNKLIIEEQTYENKIEELVRSDTNQTFQNTRENKRLDQLTQDSKMKKKTENWEIQRLKLVREENEYENKIEELVNYSLRTNNLFLSVLRVDELAILFQELKIS